MLRRAVSSGRLVRRQCFVNHSSSNMLVNASKQQRFISSHKFTSQPTINKHFTNTNKKHVAIKVSKCSYASLPSGLNELKMPALSPTMEKGTIVSWRVKVGDKVSPGDVLCEIETDKAKLEFEFQEEGYVAKIFMPDDSKDVQVGDTIGIIAESKDDIGAAADITLDTLSSGAAPSQSSSGSQQKQEQTTQETSSPKVEESSGSGELPNGCSEIKMPALSPTMTAGTIVRWVKKEGDKLSPGDVLCEVETDKATIDFEFQEEGYLGKILVQEGTSNVELFSVIALLAEDKDAVAACANYTPGSKGSAKPKQSAPKQEQKQEAPQQQKQQQQQPAQQKSSGDRIFASPLAKKTANESGVELSAIGSGSGPNGRIIKQDVEEFVASGKSTTAATPKTTAQATSAPTKASAIGTSAEEDYTDIPVSNIRKVIANRLSESKQTIPHYYLSVECEIDELMKVRADLNKKGDKRGYKLSVNDFLIKASAASMKKVPAVNSSWRDTYIRQFKNVDVSVAVQTDSGLITPIVFNAESKGLSDISSSVKQLAEKARNGKLQPQEFQGGTFTVSNLGMFGVDSFTAIINPPQAAILAVGAAQQKVVLNPDVEKDGEKFKVVTTIQVTLSCDHRVIDGAVGAQWLQEFKLFVENPMMLLL